MFSEIVSKKETLSWALKWACYGAIVLQAMSLMLLLITLWFFGAHSEALQTIGATQIIGLEIVGLIESHYGGLPIWAWLPLEIFFQTSSFFLLIFVGALVWRIATKMK